MEEKKPFIHSFLGSLVIWLLGIITLVAIVIYIMVHFGNDSVNRGNNVYTWFFMLFLGIGCFIALKVNEKKHYENMFPHHAVFWLCIIIFFDTSVQIVTKVDDYMLKSSEIIDDYAYVRTIDEKVNLKDTLILFSIKKSLMGDVNTGLKEVRLKALLRKDIDYVYQGRQMYMPLDISVKIHAITQDLYDRVVLPYVHDPNSYREVHLAYFLENAIYPQIDEKVKQYMSTHPIIPDELEQYVRQVSMDVVGQYDFLSMKGQSCIVSL